MHLGVSRPSGTWVISGASEGGEDTWDSTEQNVQTWVVLREQAPQPRPADSGPSRICGFLLLLPTAWPGAVGLKARMSTCQHARSWIWSSAPSPSTSTQPWHVVAAVVQVAVSNTPGLRESQAASWVRDAGVLAGWLWSLCRCVGNPGSHEEVKISRQMQRADVKEG